MNDDEVTQILRKWNLSNPPPKKNIENINVDTRTFTRPKRKTFIAAETELPSIESGVSQNFSSNCDNIIVKQNLFLDRFN